MLKRYRNHFVRSGNDLTILLSNEAFLTKFLKNLTIKPEMSVCLFVRYLLRRLRTDWQFES